MGHNFNFKKSKIPEYNDARVILSHSVSGENNVMSLANCVEKFKSNIRHFLPQAQKARGERGWQPLQFSQEY